MKIVFSARKTSFWTCEKGYMQLVWPVAYSNHKANELVPLRICLISYQVEKKYVNPGNLLFHFRLFVLKTLCVIMFFTLHI